jgi:hypothetical protein
MYRRRQERAARAKCVKSTPRRLFGRRRLAVETLEERRLMAGITTPTDMGLSQGLPPDEGPQVIGLAITGEESYSLFSPKPLIDGPTPLVDSLTIRVQDFPERVPALPGDYNNNGAVDTADYILWRRNFGQEVTLPNDLTPGEVEQDDYDLWRMNFGRADAGPTPDPALDEAVAQNPIHYQLVGDFTGTVRIRRVEIVPGPSVAGPATAGIRLFFDRPLADDRYTLRVSDAITDPGGNRLDGESNASQPGEPNFPSGNGIPGGDFVARFTIDSRPEIGSRVDTDINIDINGNRTWDPTPGAGGDFANVDLVFQLALENQDGVLISGGFGPHDQLFAGKFVAPEDENPKTLGNGSLPARLFDQLAAYGTSAALGGFRWLIDTDGNGVVRLGTDILAMQPNLPANLGFNVTTAVPVAGDFAPDQPGDEIGLYNAGKWAFDTNGDHVITDADLFITGGLLGYSVVGDFDGDSQDDLAVFNSNTWYFDLANDGLGGSDTASGASQAPAGQADRTLVWGLAGTQDRPLAADMDQDGIDDIGLWLPAATTTPATWRFLVSNDPSGTRRQAGNINTLSHAFSQPPSGSDYFAQFGNDRWRPVVGNFDPPPPGSGAAASTLRDDLSHSTGAQQPINQVFTSTRGLERGAPVKRVQFSAAVADAALSDLHLVLNRPAPALRPAASPAMLDGQEPPSNETTDEERLASAVRPLI